MPLCLQTLHFAFQIVALLCEPFLKIKKQHNTHNRGLLCFVLLIEFLRFPGLTSPTLFKIRVASNSAMAF